MSGEVEESGVMGEVRGSLRAVETAPTLNPNTDMALETLWCRSFTPHVDINSTSRRVYSDEV